MANLQITLVSNSHPVHLSLPFTELVPHQFQREFSEQAGQSKNPLSARLRAEMGQHQTQRSSQGIQIRDEDLTPKSNSLLK